MATTTRETPDDRAGLLFDYAVVHPEGFTNEEASRDLGWTLSGFNVVARALRLILADDTITLVCDPTEQNQRWRYKLVGTYTDARGWSSNRLRDLEARLETIQAIAQTMVKATDGRTTTGRKATLILAVVGALRQQLVAMGDQGHLWEE
jgi:hypothetical protein